MRLLELYCGIGACSVALGSKVSEVLPIDVNRIAAGVYEHNLPHRVHVADLRSIPQERLAGFSADLWWMSPPCQPFTRRGKQLDAEDPRSESFLSLLPKIRTLRPPRLAMENVPGFRGSEVQDRLLAVLGEAGYVYHEQLSCPHTLGWPNRRERYYLLASLDSRHLDLAPEVGTGPIERRELIDFVDPAADLDVRLRVDPSLVARYRGALDLVDRDDPDAVTATFTSAYGRSHVRSGSYLRTAKGVRRFAPHEILALLGFPAHYQLLPDLKIGNAWRLVGNSLSIPAVRNLLARLQGPAPVLVP